MFAAGEVAGGPTRLRAKALFGTTIDEAAAARLTEKVLHVIEDRLAGRDWLEGDRMTITDLATSPYIALSPQGGVDLDPYPRAHAWLARIAAMPRFPATPGWAPGAMLPS